VLLTSNGVRAQALPLALLATALGLGEVTAANRDAATASARLIHDQERARIARELHDVLSHQLSAIAIQAGAARIASRDDPRVAAQVIGSIEGIAREALTDLNRIVGALRHDENEQLDRRPQPRLDDLPELIAGARAAGQPVELVISGEPQPLPATIELVAYRVVQEALTNALRYAGSSPTRVRLSYRGDGLDLLVEDDGSPAVAVGW
jgi:signal transduction histidine kinase